VRRIAVYPGTFDPVTNGHLDLADRGRRHFDRLIMGVLRHEEKQPMFSVDEGTTSRSTASTGCWWTMRNGSGPR
jgi:pantetheine-phosphate adenylyltransferase